MTTLEDLSTDTLINGLLEYIIENAYIKNKDIIKAKGKSGAIFEIDKNKMEIILKEKERELYKVSYQYDLFAPIDILILKHLTNYKITC